MHCFYSDLQAGEKWTVAGLDTFTVLLGIGCLFAWIGLLRYFKFNYKFHVSILVQKKNKSIYKNNLKYQALYKIDNVLPENCNSNLYVLLN